MKILKAFLAVLLVASLTCVLIFGMFLLGGKILINTFKDATGTSEYVVTQADLDYALEPLDEIVTIKRTFKSTDGDRIDNPEKHLGISFSHTLTIKYEGEVKAGINAGDIKAKIDDKTIKITLPKAYVISSEVNDETVKSSVSYSLGSKFINPVSSDEVTNYLVKIEQREEKKAIDDGILQEAEENAKTTVKALLQGFEKQGYTVEFEVA